MSSLSISAAFETAGYRYASATKTTDLLRRGTRSFSHRQDGLCLVGAARSAPRGREGTRWADFARSDRPQPSGSERGLPDDGRGDAAHLLDDGSQPGVAVGRARRWRSARMLFGAEGGAGVGRRSMPALRDAPPLRSRHSGRKRRLTSAARVATQRVPRALSVANARMAGPPLPRSNRGTTMRCDKFDL
jgi:hypothetical protein